MPRWEAMVIRNHTPADIEHSRLSRSNGRSLQQEVHQQTPVLQALHGAKNRFAAITDAHGEFFRPKEFVFICQILLFSQHISGLQLFRIAQHHIVILLRIDFQHIGRFAQSYLQAFPLSDSVVRKSFVLPG